MIMYGSGSLSLLILNGYCLLQLTKRSSLWFTSQFLPSSAVFHSVKTKTTAPLLSGHWHVRGNNAICKQFPPCSAPGSLRCQALPYLPAWSYIISPWSSARENNSSSHTKKISPDSADTIRKSMQTNRTTWLQRQQTKKKLRRFWYLLPFLQQCDYNCYKYVSCFNKHY